MNKQTIISTVTGFLIAAAIFTALFLFVRMVIQDHRALKEVVTFLNAQIEASQKASSNSIAPSTLQ